MLTPALIAAASTSRMHPPGGSLTACIIGRDNERTLAACLAGVAPWVEQIVFVDTGSTDRTPDIAREFGAEVHVFPWIDDFSAARNESLRHARGEWIFWLDTDDTLDATNGKRLRELVEGTHAPDVLGYVLQVHCPRPNRDRLVEVTVVDHVKLFRNRPDLRFEGRIHEQILPAIRQASGRVAFTEIYVEHSGADHSPEGRRRKLERDLRILHQDLAERPEHSFVLFNLGMTYADASEHVRACYFLRRCLAVASPEETQVRKAYAILVSSLMILRNFKEAVRVCVQGRALYPEDPELQFRAALLDQEFGRPAEAAAKYRQVLRPRNERTFRSLDAGIIGASTRHNLALAEAARGRLDLAEIQWRRIIREQPENRLAWRALGKQLFAQGRSASLTVLVERAERHPALAQEAVVMRADLAWMFGDFDSAERLFRAATEREPKSIEAWQKWARFLFERGDPVAAECALRRLIELDSEDAAAWHNLGTVLARCGRSKEAESALRKSLELRPGDTATERDLAALNSAGELPPALRMPPAASTLPRTKSIEFPDQHHLPFCLARRDFDPATERYYCAHPRIGTPGGRVSVEFCRACRLSAEPPPVAFRELVPPSSDSTVRTCRYLGAVIGRRECESCRGGVWVKVFACDHVEHQETTWLDCRSCPDRSPIERTSAMV